MAIKLTETFIVTFSWGIHNGNVSKFGELSLKLSPYRHEASATTQTDLLSVPPRIYATEDPVFHNDLRFSFFSGPVRRCSSNCTNHSLQIINYVTAQVFHVNRCRNNHFVFIYSQETERDRDWNQPGDKWHF